MKRAYFAACLMGMTAVAAYAASPGPTLAVLDATK